MTDYDSFLRSPSRAAWERLGLVRRSGILAPLFSIQSKNSVGVGEFADLEKLADWCRAFGMSLIQLLPLNDVGTRFCPYDAESSFALEPMHLSLGDLAGVDPDPYAQEIRTLRRKYPAAAARFDTRVKQDKLALLRRMFQERAGKDPRDFDEFKKTQVYWLPAYALFKVLKEQNRQKSWEEWPAGLRERHAEALRQAAASNGDGILFQEWLQWQCFRQFSTVAARLRRKKVHLFGDLPFLVARDSADVWAHPGYFKLGLSAGAPPDLYFADGQEWGMPPYDWPGLAGAGYDYLGEKLKFASNFYDLYRLDHFAGLFRVWVFPREEAPDRKQRAAFDPPDAAAWEAQAREILRVMLEATAMLPCAEDLGTVPDIAREILREYAIPGMDVQRWMRDWKGSGEFLPGSEYRPNAIVTLSTHDMTSFSGWWKTEATPQDKERFLRFTGLPGPDVLRAALEKAHESRAIFSVHSFQDWMALCGVFGAKEAEWRINRPGVMDAENWRLRIPKTLEELIGLSSKTPVKKMNQKAKRL